MNRAGNRGAAGQNGYDRTHLLRRLGEVSGEIRNYPTPIARCDEQLAALLEERARLIERLQEPACQPLDLWVSDGGPSLR